MDINELIARWRDGDESAAEALYAQHNARTYRLAYGIVGNSADAEEVAQDALTYALVNIARFDASKSQFTTWLHTITVSRSRDKLRKRRLPQISISTWLESGRAIVDESPGPEATSEASAIRGEVWQAVQALNPSLREAVVLRFWAGHTFREMAEIMDCPLGTAQSRVRLAHRQLQQQLTADQLVRLEGKVA